MFIDNGSPKAVTASLKRNAVLAEIRFCLFWIPLEIITHENILPFSIEILHWHNVLGERRGNE